MPAIPTMSLPTSLGAAIAPIAVLTDDEFTTLARATSTPRSFSLKPKDIKELSAEVATLATNLPYALSALSFLYSRLDPYRDKAPWEAIIEKVVEDFDVECNEDQREVLKLRLGQLLETNPGFASFRKAQRLQKGFLPNAVSFRSMVDLRPDFGGDENIRFDGLLKIIQFRITTDSDDRDDNEFVFQLNEEALLEMEKAIARARDKLRALSEIPGVAPHLFGFEKSV